MPAGPVLRHLLGTAIAVVLVAGIAEVASDRGPAPSADSESAPETTTTAVAAVLPPDQAELSGTIASLASPEAGGPAVPLPLELAADPAVAGATIDGALVRGRRETIVWNGGRPLRLGGSGGINVTGAAVTVAGDGRPTWSLDGAPRPLLAGHYSVATPVALGRAGLAAPVASVDFDADGQTTITTTGGRTVVGPAGPLHLEGPGSLTITGRIDVRTAAGTRPAGRVTFGPGPFVVDLDGATLRATVRGPLTVGP